MLKIKDGISANASTATTLATARTINGTSFNGSANITTANWGTARTLTIGNTGKSVNGSANVSWSLSEIGAAAASHGTHVTYSTTAPLVAGTASAGSAATVARTDHVHPAQTSVSGNAGTATKLATARTINGTSFDGSAAITTANWGTARTLTIGNTGKSVNGSGNVSWSLSEIGALEKSAGVAENLVVTKYLKFADYDDGTATTINTYLRDGIWNTGFSSIVATNFKGSLTGNATTATTATTLATARTINGTSFNGSANITTANWGTARTLTVGNTGKSVNGSANVSWSLAEIGALPLSGGSLTGPVNNNYVSSTYLASNQGKTLINSTCSAGSYTMLYKYPSTNGYFTLGGYQNNFLLQYTAKTTVDAGTNSVTKSVTLLNESGNSSFPGTVSASSFSGSLSGNASTATTLATARTINGTSFNGSANITTANWGTARTITIGSTGKSVNGSGNVSWTLAEIGAAAASHGTHVSDSGWKTLTLATGISLATGGIARYKKINNLVYVQMHITGITHSGGGATAVAKTLTTLPSGYRPAYYLPMDATAGASQPNPCRIECNTDGTIKFRSSLNKVTTDYTLYISFCFAV